MTIKSGMAPVHPGEVLRDELAEIGLSPKSLAKAINVPSNLVTAILDGERSINSDTARRLGRYFHTTTQFWLNLQHEYQIRRAADRDCDTMTSEPPSLKVRLFYSYCHRDNTHKTNMEKSLSLLRRNALLTEWSDQQILPGQAISRSVRTEMDRSDILVFLLSQDFIASDECMKEWEYAKHSRSNHQQTFRIPVILNDCAWLDLLGDDDVKALPNDGVPVSRSQDTAEAWNQVYQGIKSVIDSLRNNFTPKLEFKNEIQETEFSSQEDIHLEDIYVFPSLKCYPPQTKSLDVIEQTIEDETQLLDKKLVLVHGDDMSGKTSLCRHLFLHLCSKSQSVLMIDLNRISGTPDQKHIREAYSSQFNGDYSIWQQNHNKTLLLDNLSSSPKSLEFVSFAREFFEQIIVTSSTDRYYSFFKDEPQLADYHEMNIQPLSLVQQERLIRKRLLRLKQDEVITDGLVDQFESRVNTIVTSNKIVPRYPFYILSILQTYEAFMPDNLSISSYGHCYHALIVTNLIKSGVGKSDNHINACFNFAEQLAFQLFDHDRRVNSDSEFNFEQFVADYKRAYIIPNALLNRLKHDHYGILLDDGRFRSPYMYFFFLGRFFSKDRKRYGNEIDRLCDQSFIRSNHLILLFIIHHTNDLHIIDDILLRIMCTLEDVAPATLDSLETARFSTIISDLPRDILSPHSVDIERQRERKELDAIDQKLPESQEVQESPLEDSGRERVNDVYRILKCGKLLGQILRNHYGSLERNKIEEIVLTIANGGLRLVNWILKDEDEIRDLATYIRGKYQDYTHEQVENAIRWISFVWTMVNVERIVTEVNVPEIRTTVSDVVGDNSTPAFDLIGYFSHLDSSSKLTKESRDRLAALLKKHRDPFIRSVLSIRTQHYMNTHGSKASVEQAICSLLDIRYVFKAGRLE